MPDPDSIATPLRVAGVARHGKDRAKIMGRE
jgi:hypothetical protein